jgi:hypothetical protein
MTEEGFYLTVVAVVAGGFVALLVSQVYYELAGEALRKETKGLRELLRVVLTAMESRGQATLNRDSEGNVTGYNHVITPMAGPLSFSGSLSAVHIPAGKKTS